jgi:hypothetical protein
VQKYDLIWGEKQRLRVFENWALRKPEQKRDEGW